MNDNLTLRVNEIFFSIQGESTHAGKPCLFIRLTGCNLRCHYCDTAYAWDDGQIMDMQTIINTIRGFPCRLVEITGGEPLHQPAVHPLLSTLCDLNYQVLLETNGSYPVDNVDPRVIRMVDVKCPSSGMESHNHYDNLNKLIDHDELKFIIADRRDYDWSLEILNQHPELTRITAVLFSPVHGRLAPDEPAEWIKDSGIALRFPNVRLQIALHKYIWPGRSQGV